MGHRAAFQITALCKFLEMGYFQGPENIPDTLANQVPESGIREFTNHWVEDPGCLEWRHQR
jgi:hypothetical protein